MRYPLSPIRTYSVMLSASAPRACAAARLQGAGPALPRSAHTARGGMPLWLRSRARLLLELSKEDAPTAEWREGRGERGQSRAQDVVGCIPLLISSVACVAPYGGVSYEAPACDGPPTTQALPSAMQHRRRQHSAAPQAAAATQRRRQQQQPPQQPTPGVSWLPHSSSAGDARRSTIGRALCG